MRWFIALLLLANVVLFFWVQQQSKPAPGSTSLPPPEVGHLRLMNEPGGAPDRTAGPAASVPGPDVASDRVPEAAPDSVPPPAGAPSTAPRAEPSTAAVPSPVPAGPQAGGTPSLSEELPALAPAAPPAAGRQPETAAGPGDTVDVAGPSAAEQGAAEQGAAEQGGAEEGTAADESAATPSCARIGPFEPKDADALLAGLPPSLELVSDTSEEYAEPNGYYVLIPALPSRAAGLEKLAELRAAGINDVWLFRSGEMQNAISLGLYSSESGAKRHTERVAQQGFAAEVRTRTSTVERRWLQLRDNLGGGIVGLPLPDGVEAAPVACP